jgi:hypothetical protein
VPRWLPIVLPSSTHGTQVVLVLTAYEKANIDIVPPKEVFLDCRHITLNFADQVLIAVRRNMHHTIDVAAIGRRAVRLVHAQLVVIAAGTQRSPIKPSRSGNFSRRT